MCAKQIHKIKINQIREAVIQGGYDWQELAARINVSVNTVWKYTKIFKRLKAKSPDRLYDGSWHPLRQLHVQRLSQKNAQMRLYFEKLFRSGR